MTTIFLTGEAVTWDDRFPAEALRPLINRYGEGTFQVIGSEENTPKTARNVAHPQVLTMQTNEGVSDISGVWFKKASAAKK